MHFAATSGDVAVSRPQRADTRPRACLEKVKSQKSNSLTLRGRTGPGLSVNKVRGLTVVPSKEVTGGERVDPNIVAHQGPTPGSRLSSAPRYFLHVGRRFHSWRCPCLGNSFVAAKVGASRGGGGELQRRRPLGVQGKELLKNWSTHTQGFPSSHVGEIIGSVSVLALHDTPVSPIKAHETAT